MLPKRSQLNGIYVQLKIFLSQLLNAIHRTIVLSG